MNLNFNQSQLEILSEALDELNYRLDMQLHHEDQDYYGRRELTAKLQDSCYVHDRIIAALALETEINEMSET